jgi:hypothetical protein
VFLQVSPLERSPKKGLSFRCCAALGNLSGKKAPDCSAGGFCNTLNGKQLISFKKNTNPRTQTQLRKQLLSETSYISTV